MTGQRHWAEAWLGRLWIAGEFNCADFVVEVLREEFGYALTLPAHAATVKERDGQIAALKGVYAVRTIAPREGDGVLMAAAARRRRLGHHIGIWCAVAGEPYVLHYLEGVGSILHPLRDLDRRALVLEGVYRWI